MQHFQPKTAINTNKLRKIKSQVDVTYHIKLTTYFCESCDQSISPFNNFLSPLHKFLINQTKCNPIYTPKKSTSTLLSLIQSHSNTTYQNETINRTKLTTETNFQSAERCPGRQLGKENPE